MHSDKYHIQFSTTRYITYMTHDHINIAYRNYNAFNTVQIDTKREMCIDLNRQLPNGTVQNRNKNLFNQIKMKEANSFLHIV